jgi:acyl transferase domain-containing protein
MVPHLDFRTPNPAVTDFDETFEVPVTPQPWPGRPDRPRRAGVSAFGMGGTNAHVILEQPPEPRDCPVSASDRGPAVAGVLPWVLSARSEPALREQAARLRELVAADASLTAADVGFSLLSTRTLFEHRAVVLGGGRDELLAGLAKLASGGAGPGVVIGAAPAGGTGRVGFLFPGQGAQRAGMGRELHAASPAFAAAFDRACALLEAELGLPVAEVVLGPGPDERADRTVFAQAGLFAVEVGLVALLAAAGIRPDAVTGHSVGEIAAAHAAGVLSLQDACALVAARGRLMQALPAGGAMIAVEATEAEISDALTGVAGVSVAAVNAPSSVVVSGDAEAVAQVAAGFGHRGRRTRALRVSHAFHSHRMEPILDELGRVAARLHHAAPRVAWTGALTGQPVSEPSPEYWVRQTRGAVRYADAVADLAARGVSIFVEAGPGDTLSGMGADVAADRDGVAFVPLLRPGRQAPAGGLPPVATGLAEAFVCGAPMDWAAMLPGGRRVHLPTYAFQRQRYWLAAPRAGSTAASPPALDSEQAVLRLVCAEAAAVLGGKGLDIPVTATFKDLGFSSATAVQLRNRLNAAAGVRLPATVAFSYPTPQALGGHIFALLAPDAPGTRETTAPDVAEDRSDEDLYELVDRGYA